MPLEEQLTPLIAGRLERHVACGSLEDGGGSRISQDAQDAQDSIPLIGEQFHFYHSDLGPGNIMISEENAKVSGILDWEGAGFLPKFWFALKVGISAGFLLDPDHVGEEEKARTAWALPLMDALIAEGFASPDSDLAWWRGLMD
jgi:Phosphotransferase enzyme family